MMRCAMVVVWGVLCAGCATPDAGTTVDGDRGAYIVSSYGRVVRVQPDEGYVVLECAVLPKTGERITLRRGERAAATVTVSRVMSGRHAAADIVDGVPMPGDWYRMDN